MKVLLIASPNLYGRGGEVRSYEIIKRLRNFKADISLLTDLTNESVLWKLSNYVSEILKVKCPNNNEICIALLIKKISHLSDKNIDLIVSHSEHPRYALSAFYIAKLLKRPWTAIINSYIYLYPYSYGVSISRVLRNTFAFNCLNTTIVHLVSPIIQYELQKRGFGFKYFDILEVPVGISWEKVKNAEKTRVVKKYDLAFMGVLSIEKGIFDIAYIIYKLKKKLRRDVKAVLIGEFNNSSEKNKYLTLLKKLDLYNNIIFKGHLTGEVKYLELAKAKLFVYPSKVDIFPISILEALAMRLPIIIIDLPFAWEFKTDAVVKVKSLDEYVDVIFNLLNNDEEREKLGKLGNLYAKRYTWENATYHEYKAYLKTIKWWLYEAK
jgi:glycosyltransferase involved in cell wall biosynthesis